MHQGDSASSSSSGEEVDTDVEETRPEGDNSRYNWPIFTGEEGKVTQAPEGGQVKCKVILEYSSDEMSESQLDQDQEDEEKCEAHYPWPPDGRGSDRFVHCMV